MKLTTDSVNVIVYHKNCNDGVAAAWHMGEYLKSKYPDHDLVWLSADYGNDQKVMHEFSLDTNHRHPTNVFIVDFSLSGECLDKLTALSGDVVVLDHHETAINKLTEYYKTNPKPNDLRLVLDKTRSGVGLAVEYTRQVGFHEGLLRSGSATDLALAIEDYDLWKFNIADSKAIATWVNNFKRTPSEFGTIVSRFEVERMAIILGGKTIMELIEESAEKRLNEGPCGHVPFDGRLYPVYMVQPEFTSLTLGYINQRIVEGVAITWMYLRKTDQFKFSIRSKKGLAALPIAEYYGGGGHETACGFTLDADDPRVLPMIGVKTKEELLK